jgi:hypothetical protein
MLYFLQNRCLCTSSVFVLFDSDVIYTGDEMMEAYSSLFLTVPLNRRLRTYISFRCFEFLITKPKLLYASLAILVMFTCKDVL